MNSERRIQRIREAVPPLGNARPDWRIICEVAGAMGKGEHFAFNSPEEIWNEIREVWPAGRGITYDRLDHGGLQWPCPEETHPGTTILHEQAFGTGDRASFAQIDFKPTEQATSLDFPILLTTGRTLMQFNAGTMTTRTRNLFLRPTDTLDLSPFDGRSLGLHNGDLAKIISAGGEATLPVRIDDRIQPGAAFATFHSPDFGLNNVTGAGRDEQAHTPEYKIVAVRVEKARGAMEAV